jgi:hypothetical protein
MPDMAPPKKVGTNAAKKPNRTRPFGVQFYTDKETYEALLAYIASQPQHKRPKKRDVIESAVHILLTQEGFWPPKGKSAK